jgi:hypothetical protein
MPDLTVEIPNWFLQTENILEELNEEAVVFDSQLSLSSLTKSYSNWRSTNADK